MITKDKIKIYKKFNGDLDYFARVCSPKDKKLMKDEDWFLIDDIIQDIKLIRKGLTSVDYENKINQKIKEKIDCSETLDRIKQIVKKK